MADINSVDNNTVNTFHWLISEYWDIFILARLGYYDMIEDKMERILVFLKENGITEASMALEDEINKHCLIELINKFK